MTLWAARELSKCGHLLSCSVGLWVIGCMCTHRFQASTCGSMGKGFTVSDAPNPLYPQVIQALHLTRVWAGHWQGAAWSLTETPMSAPGLPTRARLSASRDNLCPLGLHLSLSEDLQIFPKRFVWLWTPLHFTQVPQPTSSDVSLLRSFRDHLLRQGSFQR